MLLLQLDKQFQQQSRMSLPHVHDRGGGGGAGSEDEEDVLWFANALTKMI
jgi:hypothetical protein